MAQQLDQFVVKVDQLMAKYPTICLYDQLKQVEAQTGYSKVYFFVAGSTALTILLTILGGPKLIVDLVGFLYPAYMSFKAMDTADVSDDTQWLTYWVVFSFLSLLEGTVGFLVAFIPFYFWVKLALVMWMHHPSTKGAETVYQQVLRPLVLPYLKAADKTD